ILAVPNAALIAAGLAQPASDASLNQALSDCSASAYSGFSQNNRRVLREMIRIVERHYGTIPYWEQRILGVHFISVFSVAVLGTHKP
ncbi:MAG TPA: hypothetical protein VJ180_15370, partial [Pyrinomonadaceae bacterium]|nr:hypothetical protein [Pyrinomonadaceae bacterium]